MTVFALLRPRAGHPWVVLGLAAVAVLPTVAAAQSGPEIMQKHRQIHRVKDEEEQLLLRLVSKSGAVKERRVVRFTMNGADDLNKILIRFLAPRDVSDELQLGPGGQAPRPFHLEDHFVLDVTAVVRRRVGIDGELVGQRALEADRCQRERCRLGTRWAAPRPPQRDDADERDGGQHRVAGEESVHVALARMARSCTPESGERQVWSPASRGSYTAGCCTTMWSSGSSYDPRHGAGFGRGSGDRMSCNTHHQRRAVMRRAVIGLVAVGSLVSLLVGLVSAQAKKPDATLT